MWLGIAPRVGKGIENEIRTLDSQSGGVKKVRGEYFVILDT
jgi:hypothetical protein